MTYEEMLQVLAEAYPEQIHFITSTDSTWWSHNLSSVTYSSSNIAIYGNQGAVHNKKGPFYAQTIKPFRIRNGNPKLSFSAITYLASGGRSTQNAYFQIQVSGSTSWNNLCTTTISIDPWGGKTGHLSCNSSLANYAGKDVYFRYYATATNNFTDKIEFTINTFDIL